MEHQPIKKASNRVWAGIILLAVGGVLLLNRMGFPFPGWLFQWPMILIIVGVFDAIRNGFRSATWVVLILVGGFFLLDSMEPQYELRRYTWPLIVISIGAGLILRPNRQRPRFNDRIGETPYGTESNQYAQHPPISEYRSDKITGEDYLDAVSIFGSTRKIVVSQNFRGGDLVSLFGGHEVDLRQADIQGTVIVDVTQIFGGTKLILPSSWEVKSEMVALLGGIEDKRQMPAVAVSPGKILILKGTSIFGGIDIRNY